MKHIYCFSRWTTGPAAATAALYFICMIGGTAWADQLSISNPDAPTAPPQPYKNITVDGVENGKITFHMEGGNQISKELSRVADLRLDDEKSLNDAGDSFAAGNFDAALDGYNRTLQNTHKAWLKAWILPHIIDAANKAGRFDAALSAYITLVGQNPQAAQQHKPVVPATGSAQLDPAAAKLTAAIDAADDKSKLALRGLLLDVQKSRKDDAAVKALVDAMSASGTSSVGSTAIDNDAMADAKLTQAKEAIKDKNYDKAIATINESKATYTTPHQQADALYVMAQALEGKASAGTDADALKDAAIAYMRVVVNFKTPDGGPHVVDSLMQTGVILEKLQQYKEAIDVYQSVVKDFPTNPRANEAGQQITRLKDVQSKAGQ